MKKPRREIKTVLRYLEQIMYEERTVYSTGNEYDAAFAARDLLDSLLRKEEV